MITDKCLFKGRSKMTGAVKTLIVSLVIMTSSTPARTTQKSPEPRAVQEIRRVLDRQVEAWNRRDLEGFMQGYWNSPNLTFYSGGTTVSGWEPTLKRYRERYQSEGREMGQLDFSDLKIELLGPSAAFVRGRFHLKMASGDSGGLFTLTFRKLEGGWKIVHDHTSTA
jgi:ketosteroid isomerase-like protein